MAKNTKRDVFISYSRKDYFDEHKNVIPGNEISKIKEALTEAGITYWFDEEGVLPGDKFAKLIVKNIKASSIFVFISTQNSNDGGWTANEIASAYMIGKKIIPVRIDKSIFHDDVLLYIARLNHIDYNNNPQKGRQDLIRSIKNYLEEEKEIIKQNAIDQRIKQDLLERQRREQEEEQKRLEEISNLKSEISAKESFREELEKIVSQKEKELSAAKVDLNHCERQIRELQKKVLAYGKNTEIIIRPDEHVLEFTLCDTIKFKMIRVEGNSFMMGATAEQGDDVEKGEKPTHKVKLTDYYIGETVVTQSLWYAVMGNNPSTFKGDNLPVENVAWEHQNEIISVQTFIRKLNEMLQDQLPQGRCFRLPTEAEWEFAAREGKSRGYKYKFSGSNKIDDVAWYAQNSDSMTHPVKTKKPNELGIYDMNGNVWEWCQDWWSEYNGVTQTNPKGPCEGEKRVYRGGCWRVSANNCRISYRYCNKPDSCSNVLGFRLAL